MLHRCDKNIACEVARRRERGKFEPNSHSMQHPRQRYRRYLQPYPSSTQHDLGDSKRDVAAGFAAQPYDSQLGILQVVVGEEHVSATEDRAEDVEAYFQQDQITPIHTRSVFGVPLFRSARFDRVLMVTMNHAIMAYWSIT